jgi:hypothetical protein
MTDVAPTVFETPDAWHGSKTQAETAWIYHLTPADVDELVSAVDVAQTTGFVVGLTSVFVITLYLNLHVVQL